MDTCTLPAQTPLDSSAAFSLGKNDAKTWPPPSSWSGALNRMHCVRVSNWLIFKGWRLILRSRNINAGCEHLPYLKPYPLKRYRVRTVEQDICREKKYHVPASFVFYSLVYPNSRPSPSKRKKEITLATRDAKTYCARRSLRKSTPRARKTLRKKLENSVWQMVNNVYQYYSVSDSAIHGVEIA